MNLWKLQIRDVFEALLYPEEVLVGHHGRYVAHERYTFNKGCLRV